MPERASPAVVRPSSESRFFVVSPSPARRGGLRRISESSGGSDLQTDEQSEALLFGDAGGAAVRSAVARRAVGSFCAKGFRACSRRPTGQPPLPPSPTS